MPFRSYRSAVAELGQVGVSNRKRVVLILSVPALSLLLPALAVEAGAAGGNGELTRIAAAVAQFLLFYSGVFALIALTAAVGAGLLAADRIVLSPDARILAQALHRTMSLIGISALANHIMLEILASRAGIGDGIVPFLAARSTFFMGLGTLSSDAFVLVTVTGVLRRRFASGARPVLWRALHLTAYAAWPLAVLHGLLAGRSAKPYVDWSYGACLAAVALALTARYVLVHRRCTAAAGGPLATSAMSLPLPPAGPPVVLPQAPARPPAAPPVARQSWPAAPAPQRRPLRALPSPLDSSWSGSWQRPPRWTGAPWTAAEPGAASDNGYPGDGYAGGSGYAGESYAGDGYAGGSGYVADGYAGDSGYAGPDVWTASPDGWDR